MWRGCWVKWHSCVAIEVEVMSCMCWRRGRGREREREKCLCHLSYNPLFALNSFRSAGAAESEAGGRTRYRVLGHLLQKQKDKEANVVCSGLSAKLWFCTYIIYRWIKAEPSPLIRIDQTLDIFIAFLLLTPFILIYCMCICVYIVIMYDFIKIMNCLVIPTYVHISVLLLVHFDHLRELPRIDFLSQCKKNNNCFTYHLFQNWSQFDFPTLRTYGYV